MKVTKIQGYIKKGMYELMMKKIVKTIMLMAVAILMLGTCAFAGSEAKDYYLTVGKFNGSAYTQYQRKEKTNKKGDLYSDTVGGKKVVDVRMECDGEDGEWTRNVTDNKNYKLATNNSMYDGIRVRAEFSNDAFTYVDVEVSGRFASN